MNDPLAAVRTKDGSLSRQKVENLFGRNPKTLTIPELEAMQAVFREFTDSSENNPLAGITYTRRWHDAFIKTTGGTIIKETTRRDANGRLIVHRTVRRYSGRQDVRHYRAVTTVTGVPVVRSRRRESHRSRPGHRRSGATSTTSSTDPGDGEPPRRSRELRHVSFAIDAYLRSLEAAR